MSRSNPSTSRTWRWAVALTVLFTLVLCLVAFRWRDTGFQWTAFTATFLRLRWQWVALACVLGLATYVGRALRWGVMLKPMAPQARLWNLIQATAIGFTAVVLLGRPGELVRPYLIATKEKVSLSSQMATWVLERILDLLTVLLVFGLALTQVQVQEVGPRLGWVLQVGGQVVAVSCTICVIVIFIFRRHSDAIRRRLLEGLAFLSAPRQEKADRLITAFLDGLRATRGDASLLLLFAYSALEWVLIAACYVCLFRAFPETAGLGWNDALVFMGFVSFGSIVQIPGIGGGMQIVTVVVLTELFHLPLELATSMALLTWIITFVVIIPPGVLLALHEGFSWKRLRRLESEVEL
ncbi:MAG: flippase-like domain-containing protein [Acidobacteria bacterium]|nr:flippase-like domain-containing protein [Acidobacteriota bacterium]